MNENIKAGAEIHAGDGGYSIGTRENYEAFVKVRNKSLAQARIKELIEESYDLAEYNYAPPQKIFNKEKFAELIVRECASVARKLQAEDQGDDIGIVIEEHFGIEDENKNS